ncbi:IclR family transcriptional regulator [Amycolatopsis regifaucium]|uniref:IclR family transcriptional regulator n=1 Tax=Amycolatopsis regifaucium TaxID=546365 RepID=A0A154MV49_9PSEU|nr:IclR family transcriptional regulator [Amycolatopsis regifaucium]KZB88218.1 IclR family transcriptional regulator [Amycolatopsis regifaucium]OKA04281.1 IclR family transcriptional regulator [Amycolatopsis regifaucium]SFH45613.1 DNA-binding transcriptional regulator, IclR family [Amycolatopsis regifaucium]
MRAAGRNDEEERTGADGLVAARVTALLSAFQPGDDALGVSELARRTGLAKSTVHRLTGHLVSTGLLERDGSALRLGLKLFEIGQLAVRRRGLVEAARPYLADLREATRNTVHLAVLEGTEVVYLDILRGPDAPSLPSRIGGRFPAHATGVGKAILAFSPESVVTQVIDAGLPRVSVRTITVAGLLRRQLAKVRGDGIAFEREESGVGVVCAASPLLDAQGVAVAALSISGWANRMHTSRVAPAVRTAALALSRTL